VRSLYRLLSALGTAKAATRGPAPLARRVARQQANKTFNRILRKAMKP
jgi:hypothetical protein